MYPHFSQNLFKISFQKLLKFHQKSPLILPRIHLQLFYPHFSQFFPEILLLLSIKIWYMSRSKCYSKLIIRFLIIYIKFPKNFLNVFRILNKLISKFSKIFRKIFWKFLQNKKRRKWIVSGVRKELFALGWRGYKNWFLLLFFKKK